MLNAHLKFGKKTSILYVGRANKSTRRMKTFLLRLGDTRQKLADLSIRKFSHFIGFFTCLTSLVLAFLFKDYLINLLTYLENKSSSNLVEFHIILFMLYVGVSLPILWGYIICILVCSYVYAFFYGFMFVILYSTLGMTISFFVCRYMFKDYAHATVNNVAYLRAICDLIQSHDKGYKIGIFVCLFFYFYIFFSQIHINLTTVKTKIWNHEKKYYMEKSL